MPCCWLNKITGWFSDAYTFYMFETFVTRFDNTNYQLWTDKALWQHSRFSFSTQIWHFCAILISSGLKNISKNKVAPSGNCTHNTNHHWIRSLMLIQLCRICHSMPVSDCQTLINVKFVQKCQICVENKNFDCKISPELWRKNSWKLILSFIVHYWFSGYEYFDNKNQWEDTEWSVY